MIEFRVSRELGPDQEHYPSSRMYYYLEVVNLVKNTVVYQDEISVQEYRLLKKYGVPQSKSLPE